MTDDELDACLAAADRDISTWLDRLVDTEARLAEVLRKAGVRSDLYADACSPTGEVNEREEPA